MNGNNLAIELKDLTKQYGKTTAVDSIALSIPKGSTLGLLGPNGAGKSTTLKMLMGMLRPTAGTVEVLGMDMLESASKIKQRVGYVPEAHHIYRWMSVGEAIQFARSMFDTWNDELSGELLDVFQLPSDRRVRALSKGMLAKLSLLLALAHEPDLLILDEPLSGLDPIARDDFIDGVMQSVCGDERTVLFSTHQLDEVNRLADSVAIMNAGRVLVHCSLEELLGNAKRVRAVLRDGRLPEAVPANTIWQRVNRREWLLTIHPFTDDVVSWIHAENAVENVEVCGLSLDDVFKDFIRGAIPC
jgi:ABC-2 type transport system ATP-binding protein